MKGKAESLEELKTLSVTLLGKEINVCWTDRERETDREVAAAEG